MYGNDNKLYRIVNKHLYIVNIPVHRNTLSRKFRNSLVKFEQVTIDFR